MIQIRLSNEYDTAKIVEFQVAMALETEDFELSVDTVNKGVTAVFNDSSKGKYFVATDNNEIVGSLLLTPEWSDWRNMWVMWIQSVYVVPNKRGSGVFRVLYDHIVEYVGNNNEVAGLRLYVDLSNHKAIEVYKKIGMIGDHYQLFEVMK